MSRIEDATAALRAFHDAEEVERLARDVMTSALIHRSAVADAIDCLRGATERREAAYWEALKVFAEFDDNVGKPDPEQFA